MHFTKLQLQALIFLLLTLPAIALYFAASSGSTLLTWILLGIAATGSILAVTLK